MVKWSGVDEDGEPWADSWEPAENIEIEANENLLKKFRKKQANQKSDPPNKKVKKEASKKKGKNKAGSDNETDYNPNSDSDSKPKRKTAKVNTKLKHQNARKKLPLRFGKMNEIFSTNRRGRIRKQRFPLDAPEPTDEELDGELEGDEEYQQLIKQCNLKN